MNPFDNQRFQIPLEYSNNVYHAFFNKSTITFISNQVTLRLKNVKFDEHGNSQNIIVNDKQILSVMDSIFNNTYKDVDKLIMMTISFIVNKIRDEYEMEEQNNKLNVWIINDESTRHAQIKLREKRPTPMIYNWNY